MTLIILLFIFNLFQSQLIKLMDYFGEQEKNSQRYSAFNDLNEDNGKVSDLYGSARTRFIRKVYTILSIQLLVTVFMTFLSMSNEAFFRFQIQHPGLFLVAVVLTIIIEIYVFCCDGGRKFPNNLIATVIFTLCQSYIVSYISSITGKTSGNSIVLMAAFLTLAITIACTLYAIFSKEDYTTSSALLVIVSVTMLIIFIILLFTDSPFLYTIYCGLGVFLFGCYLVIDTQMIMGGRTIELSVDEDYVAALLLYIDIIMIFLYIMKLFGQNEEE